MKHGKTLSILRQPLFRKRKSTLQRLKEYNDFNDVTYGPWEWFGFLSSAKFDTVPDYFPPPDGWGNGKSLMVSDDFVC